MSRQENFKIDIYTNWIYIRIKCTTEENKWNYDSSNIKV